MILEPTAWAIRPGSRSSTTLRIIGAVATLKPSALACTQPGRSTTSTGAVPRGALSPVNSRTSPVLRSAPARSSATASSASVRVTVGPSPASIDPIETASPQSTIGGPASGSTRSSRSIVMR